MNHTQGQYGIQSYPLVSLLGGHSWQFATPDELLVFGLPVSEARVPKRLAELENPETAKQRNTGCPSRAWVPSLGASPRMLLERPCHTTQDSRLVVTPRFKILTKPYLGNV